mgnify:CR=1 FL=1
MEYGEHVKPEMVVEILKKEGTIVSVEDAKLILQFMYKVANMALDIIEAEIKRENGSTFKM